MSAVASFLVYVSLGADAMSRTIIIVAYKMMKAASNSHRPNVMLTWRRGDEGIKVVGCGVKTC